jgi:hypothetical protein
VAQLRPEDEDVKNFTATALDREADLQLRNARHNNIAAYAREIAGSELDLDADLETAGIDHLIRIDS